MTHSLAVAATPGQAVMSSSNRRRVRPVDRRTHRNAGPGRLPQWLLLSLALAGLSSTTASGQIVRGRVIDAGTRNAVVGAFVVFFDDAGTRLNGVLTNELGAYSIHAPGPGLFLLRAEMIGRQSVDSRPLTLFAADTVTVDLVLPLAPIALAAIDVAAAKKCEVRPGVGGETHKVWEEARKALSLEAATRAENVFRFNIERFERETDASRTRVVSERTRYISRFTGDPFNAMPAGHLADLGFHEQRPDGNYLYGPNAEVLLSDPFLDTHCMFLRRDRNRPGQIAIAFEPVRGRRVTDIAGDLWLDENTAELRSLEFRYTNLPNAMPRGDYGGEARFQRLPGGAWIVREWTIRSPIVRLVESNLRGQQIRSEQQTGFFFEGAEVLLIQDRAGNVVDETPRAVLAGVVWDSIGNGPLADAIVYLVDTDFADTTDTAGRFRLTGLPAGTYGVSWKHAITERQGYVPEARLLDLRRGEVTETDFALTRAAFQNLSAAEAARLDSIAQLGRMLGRSDWAAQLELPTARGAPDPTGTPGRIDGRILEHETGRGVQGVRLSIRGTQLGAVTGLDGTFLIRAVPPGEYELLAEHAVYGTVTNRVTVHARENVELTIRLARDAGGIRPTTPARRAAAAREPARLYGTVLSGENGRAVPGVIVAIAGTELRRESDASGRFNFAEVPAGPVELRTEHLGFGPLSQRVELEPGRTYDAVLRLTPQAIALDPLTVNVSVEARSPFLDMQGFYDRKYYSGLNGNFLTRSDIEKRKPQLLTDIYDDVPRVQSFWVEPGRRTVRFRQPSGFGGGYGCEPAYFIDGQRYYDPLREGPNKSEVANFNVLGTDQVEAIEIYVGAAVPIQYQGAGGANCGVILLWTRRGSR